MRRTLEAFAFVLLVSLAPTGRAAAPGTGARVAVVADAPDRVAPLLAAIRKALPSVSSKTVTLDAPVAVGTAPNSGA